MPKPLSMPGYLAPVVAIAVGVLGANGFADAAGFPAVVSASEMRVYIVIRVICDASWRFSPPQSLPRLSDWHRSSQEGPFAYARAPVTAVVITMIAAGSSLPDRGDSHAVPLHP